MLVCLANHNKLHYKLHCVHVELIHFITFNIFKSVFSLICFLMDYKFELFNLFHLVTFTTSSHGNQSRSKSTCSSSTSSLSSTSSTSSSPSSTPSSISIPSIILAEKLQELEKQIGVWRHKIIMKLVNDSIEIYDEKSGNLIERFFLEKVRHPQAVQLDQFKENTNLNYEYDNLLLFYVTLSSDLSSNELHIFKCRHNVRAQTIVNSINNWIIKSTLDHQSIQGHQQQISYQQHQQHQQHQQYQHQQTQQYQQHHQQQQQQKNNSNSNIINYDNESSLRHKNHCNLPANQSNEEVQNKKTQSQSHNDQVEPSKVDQSINEIPSNKPQNKLQLNSKKNKKDEANHQVKLSSNGYSIDQNEIQNLNVKKTVDVFNRLALQRKKLYESMESMKNKSIDGCTKSDKNNSNCNISNDNDNNNEQDIFNNQVINGNQIKLKKLQPFSYF